MILAGVAILLLLARILLPASYHLLFRSLIIAAVTRIISDAGISTVYLFMLAPYHFLRDYYRRIAGAPTIAGSIIPTGWCNLLLVARMLSSASCYLLLYH